MITFEALLTIIVTLVVGYLSIMVAIGKQKNRKVQIGISVLFFLCLIVVVLFYIPDSFNTVIHRLWQVINALTPIKGKAFMLDSFTIIFLEGYVVLSIPIIILLFVGLFKKTKKTIGSKVCWAVLGMFVILFISAWVEYYISFSAYNTFAEFSLFHDLLANFILNGVATFIPCLFVFFAFDSGSQKS